MEYQCNYCGKTFTPKHSKYHTYCSYQCFTDYRNSIGLMPCPICGKVFKAVSNRHGKKTYCSPECQHKSVTKRTEGVCLQCGKTFWPKYAPKAGMQQMYCSRACKALSNQKYPTGAARIVAQKLRRRKKLKENGDVNWDITLDALIRRDKNTCHICGKQCNKKDHTNINGAFIVGPQYPSVDHLLPVSRGGTHTWDNVKLAHMSCNTVKRDRETYTQPSGQIRWAV